VGYYKVFSYAYHPSIAFAINCVILVSNAASLAAVALVGGEYITGIFIPLSKDTAWIAVAANAAIFKPYILLLLLPPSLFFTWR
jgi:APA family basic amino acid/polyamine antiporter